MAQVQQIRVGGINLAPDALLARAQAIAGVGNFRIQSVKKYPDATVTAIDTALRNGIHAAHANLTADQDEIWPAIFMQILVRFANTGTTRASEYGPECVQTYYGGAGLAVAQAIRDSFIRNIIVNASGDLNPKANPLRKYLRSYSDLWLELKNRVPAFIQSSGVEIASKWGLTHDFMYLRPDFLEFTNSMNDEEIEVVRLKQREATSQKTGGTGTTSRLLNTSMLRQIGGR